MADFFVGRRLPADKMVGAQLMGAIGEGVGRHIVASWSTIEPKLVDGPFKDMFVVLADYRKAMSSVSSTSAKSNRVRTRSARSAGRDG